MPIYEYRCLNCKQKFDVFMHHFSSELPICSKCNDNQSVQRVFSTFRVQKTYKDVYEGILSDGQLVNGLQHNDPKALLEWNRRMDNDDHVEPQFEETIGRISHGEMPPKINIDDLE